MYVVLPIKLMVCHLLPERGYKVTRVTLLYKNTFQDTAISRRDDVLEKEEIVQLIKEVDKENIESLIDAKIFTCD